MKVRAKISFMAFKRKMTIVELFADTIMKSFRFFVDIGSISQQRFLKEQEREFVFQNLIIGELQGFFKQIMKFNRKRIVGTHGEKYLKSVEI